MAELVIPSMAEMAAKGETPDVLFWVGCAGSFDDRAKKITRSMVKLLNKANRQTIEAFLEKGVWKIGI